MAALDSLLNLVKDTVLNHTQDQRSNGFDHGPLFGALDNLFRQHQQGGDRSVRPASEDRYGDPADQGGRANVKPASQDPYGDPADDRRH